MITLKSITHALTELGKVMNRVMTLIIFSLVYFLIVPFFVLFTRLFHKRSHEGSATNWQITNPEKVTAEFCKRLG